MKINSIAENQAPLFAAIEAGGTKFNLAIGQADGTIILEDRIATHDPASTIAAVLTCFRQWFAEGWSCQALGIGSFGPLDLDPASDTWGFITSTPKPGWAMTDLAKSLSFNLNLPCAIDTDVNTAALYETRFGSAMSLANAVYFTVGTGIGGGAVVDGKLVHGLLHPEMGHIRLQRHPQDQFAGMCPFHGDCAEGLAAGPAMAARWGQSADSLPPDHPAWEIEAWYIAQLALNAQMMLSPQAIVLGGGLLQVPGLLEKIRSQANQLAGGYLSKPDTQRDWDSLIRTPSVDKPGLMGALVLAARTFGSD